MPEYDRAGNECCGQSFMGGTICSDRPNHGNGHSCTCQVCGGDWMNGTCTCREICPECGEPIDGDGIDTPWCYDCEPEGPEELPVTTAELAEVYKSLGVVPPIK